MSADLRRVERLLQIGMEAKITTPVSPAEAAALLAELDALRAQVGHAEERAS